MSTGPRNASSGTERVYRIPLLPVTETLPPFDPMLEVADRELLVPSAADHKVMWRAAANPGAVLAAGEIIGAWRRRKEVVTVTPFGALSAARRKEIVKAAQAEVVFD